MTLNSDSSSQLSKRFFEGTSIRFKIILPFFFLTLIIAGVGTYALTNLVTSSFQERLERQLIDAGRVVAEGVVVLEDERLQTLRTVAATDGVASALQANDASRLSELVPQIVANNNMDAVELINVDGIGVYAWQNSAQSQTTGVERFDTDWSQNEYVQRVLAGEVDTLGDKFVFVTGSDSEFYVYSVGPVYANNELVGAVMIGSELQQMAFDLTLNAVARVTFYSNDGSVLATTLSSGQDTAVSNQPDDNMEMLINLLESQPIVITNPDSETPFSQITIQGQDYQLAFGQWKLRQQEIGVFSVAVPRSFLESTLTNSRNLFITIFSLATVGVFVGGLVVASRIAQPIRRLVYTATAVTHGNLSQRSGLKGSDEIGRLAQAFDTMTETLAQRNRQLLEQASKLEAIVDSIADGVIVLDNNTNEIVTLNPAATKLLSDMSHDFFQGPLRELSESFTLNMGEMETVIKGSALSKQKSNRYQVGNRVLGALAAPVKTPNGEQIGTVVVLRDITREVEAEELKDAFITSVSHELRTPLAAVKLSSDLIKSSANGHLDERYRGVIQNLNRGIEDLENHINQLISISEIQAGTLRLNRFKVDFNDLLNQVSEKWQPQMASKSLQYNQAYSDQPLPVNIDVAHLSWAIDNLLENALVYTPEKGNITLKAYEKDGYACLDVRDSGIGIASADQPHLFERFFRAHNNENFRARGVGLGLFITKSIIELHGGHVSVTSESGSGSTFTIAIPLVVEKESEPA